MQRGGQQRLTVRAASLKRSTLMGQASPAAFSLASSSGSENRMFSSAPYQLCIRLSTYSCVLAAVHLQLRTCSLRLQLRTCSFALAALHLRLCTCSFALAPLSLQFCTCSFALAALHLQLCTCSPVLAGVHLQLCTCSCTAEGPKTACKGNAPCKSRDGAIV